MVKKRRGSTNEPCDSRVEMDGGGRDGRNPIGDGTAPLSGGPARHPSESDEIVNDRLQSAASPCKETTDGGRASGGNAQTEPDEIEAARSRAHHDCRNHFMGDKYCCHTEKCSANIHESIDSLAAIARRMRAQAYKEGFTAAGKEIKTREGMERDEARRLHDEHCEYQRYDAGTFKEPEGLCVPPWRKA